MREMIALLVKGTPEVARLAALAHGFENVEVREEFKSARQTRLVAPLSRATYYLASAWLCEPNEAAPGVGYCDGTLLFYR